MTGRRRSKQVTEIPKELEDCCQCPICFEFIKFTEIEQHMSNNCGKDKTRRSKRNVSKPPKKEKKVSDKKAETPVNKKDTKNQKQTFAVPKTPENKNLTIDSPKKAIKTNTPKPDLSYLEIPMLVSHGIVRTPHRSQAEIPNETDEEEDDQLYDWVNDTPEIESITQKSLLDTITEVRNVTSQEIEILINN